MDKAKTIITWVFLEITIFDVCQNQLYCTDNLEIDINNASVNYTTAEEECDRRGKFLVKMVDTTTINFVNQVINTSQSYGYYVGAIRNPSERIFRWWNGTRVEMNRTAVTYNWLEYSNGSEPNGGSNESCITVGSLNSKKFVDVPCAENYGYICQRTWKINATVSTSRLVISNADRYDVRCNGTFCYIPNVTWLSRTKCELPTEGNVQQQQFRGGSSILRLQNPTTADSGNYTCSVRTAKSRRNVVTEVVVHGQPENIVAIIKECKASVKIRWKAGRNAENDFQRIIIRNTIGISRVIRYKAMRTTKNRDFIVDMTLKPSTKYEVQITTCQSNCVGNFVPAKVDFITGGTPNMVASLVANLEGSSCKVSWSPPLVIGDSITEYEITVRENVVSFRGNHSHLPVTVTSMSKNTAHSFPTHPNRNYTVSVRSVTSCGKRSEKKSLSHSCATKSKAPDKVDPPIASSPMKPMMREITLTVPSQTNGLVSCLLVVITNGTSANYTETETLAQLKAVLNSMETSYVGFALHPHRFMNRVNLTLTIGDQSSSICDPFDTSGKRNITSCTDKLICGENRPIAQNVIYRVHAVAVTPVLGNLSIQKSNDITILETVQRSPQSNPKPETPPTSPEPPISPAPPTIPAPLTYPLIQRQSPPTSSASTTSPTPQTAPINMIPVYIVLPLACLVIVLVGLIWKKEGRNKGASKRTELRQTPQGLEVVPDQEAL